MPQIEPITMAISHPHVKVLFQADASNWCWAVPLFKAHADYWTVLERCPGTKTKDGQWKKSDGQEIGAWIAGILERALELYLINQKADLVATQIALKPIEHDPL